VGERHTVTATGWQSVFVGASGFDGVSCFVESDFGNCHRQN
jgi:hypothetical protein